MKYRSDEKGFTLIEIMIVIVIIGMLVGFVALNLVGQSDEAKHTAARVQIENFGSALTLYKVDNGVFPSTEQGLRALIEYPTVGTQPKKWREDGYLSKKQIPKDPWGYEYIYVSPGLHAGYDLTSYGADNAPGGDDIANKDINSWEIDE
ncbi:MAG: type II secretion system major pseudopilin GspG [Deltaproteobacteria bacterium]|nr:type II secretion system major pseudopilin GspG [Deltaproteobacteria bacterium]